MSAANEGKGEGLVRGPDPLKKRRFARRARRRRAVVVRKPSSTALSSSRIIDIGYGPLNGAPIANTPTVATTAPPQSPFSEVLRHLDELMAEATHLRERITAALHREQRPFFPERRCRYEPHKPERRQEWSRDSLNTSPP
jgi:hypothetical protein